MIDDFINPLGEFKYDFIEGVCDVHGDYTTWRAWIGEADFPGPCPQCAAEEEALEAEKERELKKAAEKARLEAMGIKSKFEGATLETYETATESQKAAVAAVEELKRRGRGFVVLSGSYGRGKTHLACAAVRLMGGAVLTMAEISMRIRGAYSASAKKTEEEVMEGICSLPFLAIDELGRTKMQEADANWLSHIVNERYARELPTMILTNKKLARDLPKEKWAESFEAMVGDDVAQRLMADGVIIALEGENWRKRSAAGQAGAAAQEPR